MTTANDVRDYLAGLEKRIDALQRQVDDLTTALNNRLGNLDALVKTCIKEGSYVAIGWGASTSSLFLSLDRTRGDVAIVEDTAAGAKLQRWRMDRMGTTPGLSSRSAQVKKKK